MYALCRGRGWACCCEHVREAFFAVGVSALEHHWVCYFAGAHWASFKLLLCVFSGSMLDVGGSKAALHLIGVRLSDFERSLDDIDSHARITKFCDEVLQPAFHQVAQHRFVQFDCALLRLQPLRFFKKQLCDYSDIVVCTIQMDAAIPRVALDVDAVQLAKVGKPLCRCEKIIPYDPILLIHNSVSVEDRFQSSLHHSQSFGIGTKQANADLWTRAVRRLGSINAELALLQLPILHRIKRAFDGFEQRLWDGVLDCVYVLQPHGRAVQEGLRALVERRHSARRVVRLRELRECEDLGALLVLGHRVESIERPDRRELRLDIE